LSAKNRNKGYRVYLGLGSNISPEVNLPCAVAMLQQFVHFESLSTIWETPPVGTNGPDFLNAVALIQTKLPAKELKNLVLRQIETQLGRVRSADPNAPRTIDLDILIYNGQVLDDEIWHQAHLAVPLAELIPEHAHPESGELLLEIAARLAEMTPLKSREDVLIN
jgi:2-amino-4-hydroxy-6-hydroxymethyldihydropteridine diphosphokinase